MNVERARMDLAVAGVVGGAGAGGGGAGGGAGRSVSSATSASGRSRKGKEKEKDSGGGKTVPAKRRASTAGFHLDDKPPSRKGKEKERAFAAPAPISTTKETTSATTATLPLSSPPSIYDPPPPSDPLDPSESIQCICGFAHDDGFSIACDQCGRWCHAACFAIDPLKVPEVWMCWECEPREVDREGAVRIQRAQWRVVVEGRARGAGREKKSPGVERKKRGEGGGAGGGHVRKKRRISVIQSPVTATTTAAPPLVSATSTAPPAQEEDDLIDIDEPWTHSYVQIPNDIVPPDTRTKLRKHAQNWRGISAIAPLPTITPSPVPVPFPSSSSQLHSYESQIQLKPLAPQAAPYLPPESTSIRPPSYAVHTAHPITAQSLITPYTSFVTPSSKYLSDPLNGYAHLGMPRPFVHLFGPPLDVALDARVGGGKSRFVRSGCRPNAVLRPVLCKDKKEDKPKPNDTGLSFGVFAIRDLKANEEVVLGWEWDDGCAVHYLPGIIECPEMFPFPLSYSSNCTSIPTPPTAASVTPTPRPPTPSRPPSPPPPTATTKTATSPCPVLTCDHCGAPIRNTPPTTPPTTLDLDSPTSPPTTTTTSTTTPIPTPTAPPPPINTATTPTATTTAPPPTISRTLPPTTAPPPPPTSSTAPPPIISTFPSATTPPPTTATTAPPPTVTTAPPPLSFAPSNPLLPPFPHPPSTSFLPHLPHVPSYPHPPPPQTSPQHSPHHLAYLKQQMANILHLLASTFTTCACGAKARDCALVQMSAFVEGELVRSEGRLASDKGGEKEKEKYRDGKVDLGPLVGTQRGFRTKEKVPYGGGVGGVEMVEEEEEEGEETEAEAREREMDGETEADRTEVEERGVEEVGKKAKRKTRRKKKRGKGVKRKVRVEGEGDGNGEGEGDGDGEMDGERVDGDARRIRIQTPSPSPSPEPEHEHENEPPSPARATRFHAEAETMDVDVEADDWAHHHEHEEEEEEEEDDPFSHCTLPPKMLYKRNGYVVSPVVPLTPPQASEDVDVGDGLKGDGAGAGLGLGLVRKEGDWAEAEAGEGVEGDEEEDEHDVVVAGVVELEVDGNDDEGTGVTDDEGDSPSLPPAVGDGRPISYRRKDLLVRVVNGAIDRDGLGEKGDAVAGPSTSKNPPPPAHALPPKLALVSPVTGAYGIIGSNRTTIAEAHAVEKDKGKGKEKEKELVVEEDVDMAMAEDVGSPQMGWSPFTRKDSVEVQPAPAEEEEEEDGSPSTPSTHTATLSPHNHPPIPLAADADIEMEALDIPLTTHSIGNESPLSSIHSPLPLTEPTHPQTPISPLSPGAPSQSGFASDAPLSPLTPATSAHHSSLPPAPFGVNGHEDEGVDGHGHGFEQSMSPLSQISSSPVGDRPDVDADGNGHLLEAQATPHWSPSFSMASPPLDAVTAPEDEARESPAPDVVVRSPSAPPRPLDAQPLSRTPPPPEVEHLAPSLPSPKPDTTQDPPPPEPAPPSPPPQPTKVKLSLKDFALRKRKQREEKERTHASPISSSSAFASPSVTNETIAPSPAGTNEALPWSPRVEEVHVVRISEEVPVTKAPVVDSVAVSALDAEVVKMPEVVQEEVAVVEPAVESSTATPVVEASPVVPSPVAEESPVVDAAIVEATPVMDMPAVEVSPVVPPPAIDAPEAQPLVDHPMVVVLNGDRQCSEESQDMDIDDSRPSSEQPEQHVKKTQDDHLMSPAKVNGYHPAPLSSSALHNSKPSLPSPPNPTVKPNPTPPVTHEITLEAKIELVEHPVPPDPSPPPLPLHSVAPPPVPISSFNLPKDLPKRPVSAHAHAPAMSDIPLARRISQQEEGEIGEATPPPHMKRYIDSYRPRSPPTHPRSLRPPPSSAPPYRSSASFSSSSTLPNSSRPVPSAPRALRNGILASQTQSSSSYHPPPPRYTGSSYIPRGPSADRDRADRWPPPSRRPGPGWRR